MRAREFVTEQAAAGPITAYHGTFQPSIQNFAPLSHFGTLAAAEERLRFKGKKEGRNQPGRIYQVTLDIKRPFRVRDFAGIHSPTHFAFDLRQAGLIDQEEMLAITRLAGEAGQAQALIRKLRDLGFDGMIYRNKYEDPGSESYVITDPSQVISVRPADVSESRMVEYRRGVMDILRDELPDWPDYVIKDWIGGRIKNQEDLDNTLGWVRELSQRVQPNSWRQVQKMPLTFDMLYPKTRYMMKTKRQFGDSNPFMIPRDRERLEQALELVKTKGMENLPPVIMLQHPDGLELVEGWHRTMAAFRLYPKGFRVNAWIGDASGITENFADKKIKGKSRPGRVKRAGASCKGSVTDLRARAKKYGGERGRMYHWCANMKSGRQKK